MILDFEVIVQFFWNILTLLAHCGMVSYKLDSLLTDVTSHHNNNWESSHDRSKPMLLLITEKKGVAKSKIAIFISLNSSVIAEQ